MKRRQFPTIKIHQPSAYTHEAKHAVYELFRILRDLIKNRIAPAEIPSFVSWLMFHEDQINKEEENDNHPWTHVDERKTNEQQYQQ